MNNYLIAVVLLLLMMRCNPTQPENQTVFDPFKGVSDEKTESILRKAIAAAGGWSNWSSIETISYTKESHLILEDGTTESRGIQRHFYTMQPQFKANISWIIDSDEHLIEFRSTGCVKKINGMVQDVDEQSITESVLSSLYVLGMPFKLLDSGTKLAYEGMILLSSGKKADVIKATYSPDDHDNHSTIDEWYYYFDVKDAHFLGCMVYHAPTYAYIENLEFYNDLPVKFHKHRKSYRSDGNRNIQFLRAEFWYSDYEVTMVGK